MPFQFFCAKRDGDIPTGIPLTWASNAGGVGKKPDSERISLHTLRTCLQSYQPYESRSVKNKAATNVGKRRAEHSRRRPSPFFAQEDYEFVCDGLDVIRRRRRSTPPLSAAVGHRKTEPGGYFCRKLTLTPTPDHIRPTRRSPDPNRPTNGRKQSRGVCPGVLVGYRRRQ